MSGLINASGAKDLSSLSAEELVRRMRDAFEKLTGVNPGPMTLTMSPGIYGLMWKKRFRKSKVKKGCGKFRFVVIGPPRLTLRRSK